MWTANGRTFDICMFDSYKAILVAVIELDFVSPDDTTEPDVGADMRHLSFHDVSDEVRHILPSLKTEDDLLGDSES